jgi:hypothetical protein
MLTHCHGKTLIPSALFYAHNQEIDLTDLPLIQTFRMPFQPIEPRRLYRQIANPLGQQEQVA